MICLLCSPLFALEFEPVGLPDSLEEMESIRGSQAYLISDERYPINYQALIRSGERRQDQIFGLLHDREGNLIHQADGSGHISNSNDFSSLLQVDGKLFMLTHFEEIPGGIYLSKLDQDRNTGELKVSHTRPLDLSAVNGGWNHCAGSTTPWQTHLGTEEYEPNAAALNERGGIDHYYQGMTKYSGGDLKSLYPYDYGWQIEISVENFQQAEVRKRYAMGRLSHEVGLVMPDRRTVYITDDAHNTALFRFVADRPGDLSSGTLFAAHWQQTGERQGGAADIGWISLGHASEAEIRTAMDKKTRFDDLFEQAKPTETGHCPKAFNSINTRFGFECVKLISGKEKIASRLESRRYAALMGATTEFRKMEGLAFDPVKRELYIAITSISRGMEDRQKGGEPNPSYDQGGPNHIRLPFTPCGAIYALKLDQNHVATEMRGILTGEAAQGDPENFCQTSGIANPDNLTFLTDLNTLIIAEDSSQGHINNMLWAFNLAESKLTRLLTAPLGAEVTGSYYYPDVNGWGYLMTTIQHPAEGPATTGYLGPFKLP
jgi:secreted PhoX family phosphatase